MISKLTLVLVFTVIILVEVSVILTDTFSSYAFSIVWTCITRVVFFADETVPNPTGFAFAYFVTVTRTKTVSIRITFVTGIGFLKFLLKICYVKNEAVKI